MSVQDRDKHYSALTGTTPNTVSRNTLVGDRSYGGVVYQSGKPILDSELNALQDVFGQTRSLLQRQPSGFLLSQQRPSVFDDFTFYSVGSPSFLANAFHMARKEALVAGFPLVVEFTGTDTVLDNIVTLQAPQIYDGTPNTIKRTDFVFLEVWQELLAPSPHATGTIQVSNPSDGDTVTIDGTPLTAKLVPVAPTDFLIGATDADTATNLAACINTNIVTVAGNAGGTATVTVTAQVPGAAGNLIALATSNPVAFVLSGATLAGGASRPGKPAADKLYRHGNTQSHMNTWLDDDIMDPLLLRETAQRIQIQYRIRTTGTAEGVNFKDHPDGFSNVTNPIYAQGGQAAPVGSYPFVPANNAATWMSSSAPNYGVVDGGLYIAGDGSSAASTALGTLDGFVYAIPISFVFRHNDCSDPTAAIKGFDPRLNTNGGPMSTHVGYTGVLGAIPAGLSDRPDKGYADEVVAANLLDLRKHTSMTGVDLSAEHQYQIQSLLDGQTRTWAIDTASKQELGGGSGDVSPLPLVCNEIGREAALGGNPPASGNTSRGETIRNFDHFARRFGDQPVVEKVVLAFYPGDRPTAIAQGGPVAPGLENLGKYVVKAEDPPGTPITTGTWYENDELHLDLSQLDATTQGTLFQGGPWASSGLGLPATDVFTFLPAGTTISDVLSLYHDDGNWDHIIDQRVEPKLVTGIGTSHLVIQLDVNQESVTGGLDVAPYILVGQAVPPAPPDTASPRRIFVELEVTYPLGAGLTDTPDEEVVPDTTVAAWKHGPLIENDATQKPLDSNDIVLYGYREGFREVTNQYVAGDRNTPASPVGTTIIEQIVSRDRQTLHFPRRVYGSATHGITIEDVETATAKTPDLVNTEFGSSSRMVKIIGAEFLSGMGQTLAEITYWAQDPIPNYGPAGGGYQIANYFRTNAPQTAGVKEGNIINTADGTIPTILRVDPLSAADHIWTGQVGMGSVELPFPYIAPLDQIPVNDGTPPDPSFIAGTTFEWFFAAIAETSVDDFEAQTGLLSLHSFVQIDKTTRLSLGGAAAGQFPVKDAEFRAYYPYTDENAYRPTAAAQTLSGPVRHKTFTSMLARVAEEAVGTQGGMLFREGEIVLVVFNNLYVVDDENIVRFIDTGNRTCAGVYKTRGILMASGG